MFQVNDRLKCIHQPKYKCVVTGILSNDVMEIYINDEIIRSGYYFVNCNDYMIDIAEIRKEKLAKIND